MRVLIACEESQEVCKAFRALGHEAFSCDIQECSGGHPEWHIQGDALNIINPVDDGEFVGICFSTMDDAIYVIERWDLIIAHPPCTYLTVTGNRWFNVDLYGEKAIQREREREQAADFFLRFTEADCDMIAVENPIGYMNTHYRKPDQIIQPYEYGHPVRKATCLWLKGLPKLNPTNIVKTAEDKHGFSYGGALRYATDENGKIISWNDPRTAKARSKTFPGIAKAMAEQWGGRNMSHKHIVTGGLILALLFIALCVALAKAA